MRTTLARRTAFAAAFALILALGACSSSGSKGAPGNQQHASSGASVRAGTTATSVGTTTPVTTPATPTPAATGIPAGAHVVSAADYQVGTDDYHGTAHAMPGIVQFTTPSGNIACTYSSGSGATLYCDITAHDFALPARPASCTLNWAGGLMTLDRRAAVLGHCVGGEDVTTHSRTLAYGDELTAHGIACYSGRDALTCTDHGHGFRLSRGAVHTS